MKTSIYITFLVISLVLVSCKKDKEEPTSSGAIFLNLQATWNQSGVKMPFLLNTDFVQEITGDTLNFDVFSI